MSFCEDSWVFQQITSQNSPGHSAFCVRSCYNQSVRLVNTLKAAKLRHKLFSIILWVFYCRNWYFSAWLWTKLHYWACVDQYYWRNLQFYYNFTVNYPPSASSLGVTPTIGIENKQVFTMTVMNPVSINNFYPLKFSFGYFLNAEKVHFSSYSSNPIFSFVLGYVQQTVPLFVIIFDTLGDITQLNTTLTLQIDPLFDTSTYFYKQIQSNPTFYPQLPAKIVNLINLVILRDYNLNWTYSPSSQLLNDSFVYSLQLINLFINSSIYSTNIVDNVLSMVYQLTRNPYLISNINTNLTRNALSHLFALDSRFGISLRL